MGRDQLMKFTGYYIANKVGTHGGDALEFNSGIHTHDQECMCRTVQNATPRALYLTG